MVDLSKKEPEEMGTEKQFIDYFKVKTKRWFSLFFLLSAALILFLSLFLKYFSTYGAFILFVLMMVVSVILLLINNSLIYKIYRGKYYEAWKKDKADKGD